MYVHYSIIFNLDVLKEEKKKAKQVQVKFNIFLKRKNKHNTFYKTKTSKKGWGIGWAFGKEYLWIKFKSRVQVKSSRKI
eukprot:snap_masked-scaffold_33-processed-gene-3.4-mRNA-1 protein AED:1.00 eAED:1.00 QI:0/0/0/0/1/1/3/0/78